MKKYKSLVACLLILVAFLLFNAYEKNKNPVLETFNVNSPTKEEITDELAIALFIEEITNEIIDFYSEYYSGQMHRDCG